MNYQPRAGSIGERSLAYLREHGRTSLADLADGIESETAGMGASLTLCVSNGLIVRDEVKGRTYYSLPAATALLDGVAVDAVHAGGAQPTAESVPAGEVREMGFVEGLVAFNADTVPVAEVAQVGGDSKFRNIENFQTLRPGDGSEKLATPLMIDEAIGASAAPLLWVRAEDTKALDEKPRHFEFGLYSDGRFVIELADTVATLTRDETTKLFKFVHGIEETLGGQ